MAMMPGGYMVMAPGMMGMWGVAPPNASSIPSQPLSQPQQPATPQQPPKPDPFGDLGKIF